MEKEDLTKYVTFYNRNSIKNIFAFLAWFFAFTLYIYVFFVAILRIDMSFWKNNAWIWVFPILSIICLLIVFSIYEIKKK